jgi:hypothetical protein
LGFKPHKLLNYESAVATWDAVAMNERPQTSQWRSTALKAVAAGAAALGLAVGLPVLILLLFRAGILGESLTQDLGAATCVVTDGRAYLTIPIEASGSYDKPGRVELDKAVGLEVSGAAFVVTGAELTDDLFAGPPPGPGVAIGSLPTDGVARSLAIRLDVMRSEAHADGIVLRQYSVEPPASYQTILLPIVISGDTCRLS